MCGAGSSRAQYHLKKCELVSYYSFIRYSEAGCGVFFFSFGSSLLTGTHRAREEEIASERVGLIYRWLVLGGEGVGYILVS